VTEFPILWPTNSGAPASIPWSVIAPHEKQALKNHGGQSLKRLAERGGLSPCKAVAVLEDRAWLRMPHEAAVARLLELTGGEA